MTNRERVDAVLHYRDCDRIPIMHFGFWPETFVKWGQEGHLSAEELQHITGPNVLNTDGSVYELHVSKRLGFDDNILFYTGQKGNWYASPLFPHVEPEIVEYYPDGSYKQLDVDGVYVLGKDEIGSIPQELEHNAKDRESWENFYVPRLQWTEDRFDPEEIAQLAAEADTRDRYLACYAGSLYGKIRNYWGLIEISYLEVDEPELFQECIDIMADLAYETTKQTFAKGVKPDFVHFWEDICYNKGPLISPTKFRQYCGKNYRRIADLAHQHGVDILTVDCDGYIDDLVPVWLDNGVNTMFPIEVGAWNYDFATMRQKFGKELRGIGNVNKHILSQSREAIDQEIDRIRRLVDLGGFIPCLDHRIPPEAEWDLCRYYCDRMREVFQR